MKPELLAPAGDLNTVRIALRFGADAVYLGGEFLQLRAPKVGFSDEDLRTAIREAHAQEKKIYVTVNAFARDDELAHAATYAKRLYEIGADAVIVSDAGAMDVIHRAAPRLPIHVSTQANCTNAATAHVYATLGASRVVPARELTLAQLRQMRASLPKGMEIETFVHGAMCMSYSGRCMLSAFLTGRSANRGMCTHPCRWKYALMEETRPGQYFPVEEYENGMAILSSYDLNCLPFLEELVDAGIASFKIEGRMKSEYYVATVVRAYRKRLDDILSGKPSDMDFLLRELGSVSHRPYSSGFYFGELKHTAGDGGEYLQDCVYVARVLSHNGGKICVELKNKFQRGDVLEVVRPDCADCRFVAESIEDENGIAQEEASVPDRIYFVNCPEPLQDGDLLRVRL